MSQLLTVIGGVYLGVTAISLVLVVLTMGGSATARLIRRIRSASTGRTTADNVEDASRRSS